MNELQFSYPRIIESVTNGYWCITPSAYGAILAALEAHMEGNQAATMPSAMPKEPRKSMASTTNGIGVVEISGVIGKKISMVESMCGGVDVNAIVGAVNALVDNPSVSTIVLDWNSPGGTVTGVPEAYDALLSAGRKKPLISYTDTQMCSAAQWLASASTAIYAAKSAQVASVGVYNMVLDRSAQLAKDGIRVDPISAGKFKLTGASFKPLSSDERAMMQDRVDAIHSDFKKAVTRGRNVPDSAMEGQCLTGEQGTKCGMIDGNYPSLQALIGKLGLTRN